MLDFLKDNTYLIYIVICITVFNYGVFRRRHRIMIIYIISYGLVFFNIISDRKVIVMLIAMLFLYEEYMNGDVTKNKIIKKIRYKIIDFCYVCLTQYSLVLIIIAIGINDEIFNCLKPYSRYASLIVLFIGIHFLSHPRFELNTYEKMLSYFTKYVYDNDEYYDASLKDKYNLLCDIEDKSYFYRKKSHSIFSKEYRKYKLERSVTYKLEDTKCGKRKILLFFLVKKIRSDYKSKLILRGYSTIEMQLLKNIAIKRGFFKDEILFRRKSFELIYSKLFFNGLKEYYRSNTCSEDDRFKKFIIYVYLKTVPTTINGEKYQKLTDALEEGLLKTELETMFVLYLGLNMSEIGEKKLKAYSRLIKKYKLDEKKIWCKIEEFSKK